MKYLLDTNVISDHYKGVSPALDGWMHAQVEGDLAISAITVLELDRGVRQRERRDPAQEARLRLWLDDAVRPRRTAEPVGSRWMKALPPDTQSTGGVCQMRSM